ncbi:MAG: trypsin-like peptidase domain-containing protein [Clostridia bacterium]|nr:trypsin-like peptidase domain-containing protein [Clostridia bacterium]
MNNENDNRFYDEEHLGFEGWSVPQPPTPMGRAKRHTGRWILGILIALFVIAFAGGVVYLYRNIGFNLDHTQNGFTFSIGPKAVQPAEPETEERTLPAGPEQLPAEAVSPQPDTHDWPDATLTISSSRLGSDTMPSNDENAMSLQEIYASVIDSVVSISSATSGGTATGTGILMSSDGYVITNHHVIKGAAVILVLDNSGNQYEAEIVGSDETSDLAVLKIDATGLQPAEFGNSSVLRVGDSVVAIGDPLGTQLRGTMTNGIISAINRDLTVNDRKMTLIQTNAALNNGNSGGPLINCYGQVIGINTIKMSSYYNASATVEGLGFAIPINNAKPIIDELIDKGYVSGRPAIGISSDVLPTAFRIYYNLPSGVYVASVMQGTDAAAKGLAKGDIITAINGTKVSSLEELNTVKNQFVAGDTVTLTVYRSGQYYDVDIRLVDQATGK